MNIMKTFTLRSLKSNRKRTVVTIIAIIISSAMICGVATIAASFQDLCIRSAIETDGNYHATFHDVSFENVKYLAESAYTETSMLSRDLAYARFEQSTNEYRPYLLVREYDAAALQNMPVKLVDGRFPERAGEILVTGDVIRGGGEDFHVGRTVSLELGRRVGEDGIPLTQHDHYDETETFEPFTAADYTITGIMERPRFDSPRAPGYAVIAYLDRGGFAPEDPVNVSILVKEPKKVYEQAPELAQNAGEVGVSYNSELLRWSGIAAGNRARDFISAVSLIVILLIVVGSVTVIYNAFAISVSERKKQFGLMACIGTTPKQIRKAVFFEGVVLGLIGLPAGILSGILGIGLTLSVVNRLFSGVMFSDNLALRLVVYPGTVLVTVVFITLIIFLSAFLPALRASRISPIDAIRQSSEIRITGRKLKTSRLTRRLFGIGGELALKNLKRNRARYRATVFSLFISIVLFIAFSSFIAYAFKGADFYYEEVLYDVSVVFYYDASEEEQDTLYSRILALEDIGRYAVVRPVYGLYEFLESDQVGDYIMEMGMLPVEEDGRYLFSIVLKAVGEAEFIRFAAENGLDPAEFNDTGNLKGILINRSVIQERGGNFVEYKPVKLKAGDRLSLVEYWYDDENRRVGFDMEIGAVTAQYPLGVSYAHADSVKVVISGPVYEAISLLYQENNRTGVNRSQLFIQSDNSARLVEQIERLSAPYGSFYINDVTGLNEDVRRTRTGVSIFLYGFVTLITLIGVSNIFNTISTNVALRRREFAVLKSVGLTPRGFNRMINYESTFYGLKALLYGLPVGILVSCWLYGTFGGLFAFTFTLMWKEIAACIVGVMVIVFVTMLHASARLKNENIIDALKEENL